MFQYIVKAKFEAWVRSLDAEPQYYDEGRKVYARGKFDGLRFVISARVSGDWVVYDTDMVIGVHYRTGDDKYQAALQHCREAKKALAAL